MSTRLASIIRRHLTVDGYCPVCVLRSGRPEPAPCDVTVEARAELKHLVGGD